MELKDNESVSGNGSYVSGNVPDGYAPGITLEELRQLLIELGIAEDPDAEETESVSGNDAADTVSGNDAADTVSGNIYSVSDNSVSYNGVLTDIYGEVSKENVPIWEKKLEDYTVSEGLLLLIFLLLLGILASLFLRGGEKYV